MLSVPLLPKCEIWAKREGGSLCVLEVGFVIHSSIYFMLISLPYYFWRTPLISKRKCNIKVSPFKATHEEHFLSGSLISLHSVCRHNNSDTGQAKYTESMCGTPAEDALFLQITDEIENSPNLCTPVTACTNTQCASFSQLFIEYYCEAP